MNMPFAIAASVDLAMFGAFMEIWMLRIGRVDWG